MASPVKPQSPSDAPSATIQALYNALCYPVEWDAGVVVVDVRPFDAFAESHISGALNARLLLRSDYMDFCALGKWRSRHIVFFYSSADVTQAEFAQLIAPLWREEANPARRTQFVVEGGIEAWRHKYPFLLDGAAHQSFSMYADDPLTGDLPPVFPSEIVEGFLYLGCLGATTDKVIEELGITHVVRVLVAKPNYTTLQDLTVLHVPLEDNPKCDLFAQFGRIVDFIDDARRVNGRVLVHCAKGVSRSASAVIAYMMATRRLTVDAAREAVASCRPFINPNKGFLEQLKKFESSLHLSRPGTPAPSVTPGPSMSG